MHKLIQEEVNVLNRDIEKVKAFEADLKIAEKAKELFKDLKITLSLGYRTGTLQGVLVHCYPKHADAIKPVLDWFSDHGLGQIEKPDDFEIAKRRSYVLGDRDKKNSTTRFTVSFFFYDGASCKFVKVGEKVEPIMKLVCG
jgi:hypothetical protein